MKRISIISGVVSMLGAMLASSMAHSESGKEWTIYGGDYANTR